jgi:hypothetical protein
MEWQFIVISRPWATLAKCELGLELFNQFGQASTLTKIFPTTWMNLKMRCDVIQTLVTGQRFLGMLMREGRNAGLVDKE